MNLQHLEAKHQIKFPEIFHQLNQSKMLSWGEFGATWFTEIFPILQINPPFLLYAPDFVLINQERISEEIEAFKDPDDFRQTNPKHQFIPFAATKAGDLYCFQLDEMIDEHIPITLVWHDMNYAEVLASNIQDFIFTFLLETLLESEEDSLIHQGDFSKNAALYLKNHLQYLTPEQQKMVKKWYFHHENGMLTDAEKERLRKEKDGLIHFKSKNFEYQLH